MNKKTQRHQSAFTLLEVIIALGLMASVMILLNSSWKGNYNRVAKIKFQSTAAQLLQLKMSEIENRYKKRINELPEEVQNGEFKDEKFKKYRWRWEVRDFKMPDLSKLIGQTQDDNPLVASIATNMQTYFENSIKEVKLTIIYKSSPQAKEQKASVATLLVDYDQKLQIQGGF